MRVESVLRLAAIFLAVAALDCSAADEVSKAKVEAITTRLKECLPKGWEIVKTEAGQTPDGWKTDQPDVGIAVNCKFTPLADTPPAGPYTISFHFLPRDWMGICLFQPRDSSAFLTLSFHFRIGDEYKIIATVPDYKPGFLGGGESYKLQQAMFGKFGSTPNLVNSGDAVAQKIFGARLDATDQAAQELIKKHCNTPEQFEAAAFSLLLSGIPARSVYLRAAREVNGSNKDFFCSAVGQLGMKTVFDPRAGGLSASSKRPINNSGGDKEAVDVLCEIVADEKTEDAQRARAAMALGGHQDNRIGPLLAKALTTIKNDELAVEIAKVLAHQPCEEAGPALLALFKRVDRDAFRVALAECLAELKFKAAIPEIEKLALEIENNKNVRIADWAKRDMQKRIKVALKLFSAKENEITPVLEATHLDFFVGEQIQLKVGQESPKPMDSNALMSRPSELSLVRSDGTVIFSKDQKDELMAYIGPTSTPIVSHTESLNQLAPNLAAGTYSPTHKSGDEKVTRELTVRELPLRSKIAVKFEFPEEVSLTKASLLKVKVRITNDSTAKIQFVAPDSNYSADVFACAASADPPMARRFSHEHEFERCKEPDHRVQISNANLRRLALITLQPGESCAVEPVFEDESLKTDELKKQAERWLPPEKFEMIAGLVLYLIAPEGAENVKRPIGILYRSKSGYQANGKKSDAELKPDYPYWDGMIPVDNSTE